MSNFYSDKIDLPKCKDGIVNLISNYNFSEIMWMFRNITYDQIAYWSKDEKSIIYDNPSYSPLCVEQANRLQNQLSALCDLFTQSIVKKREFDEEYLRKYEFASPYISKVSNLEDTLSEYKSWVADLYSKIN